MMKISNNELIFTGRLEQNDKLKNRIKNDSTFNQYGIYQTLKAIANIDDGKIYKYEEKKMLANYDYHSLDTIAMIKDEEGNKIVSKVITSINEIDSNYEAPKSFISEMISEFAQRQYGIRVDMDAESLQKDIFNLMV